MGKFKKAVCLLALGFIAFDAGRYYELIRMSIAVISKENDK